MRFLFLLSAVLFVGVGLLAACNSNEMFGPQATGKPAQQPQTQQPQTQQPPSDGAPRITAQELHDLWQKNHVLIVDTRGEAAWQQSHIKGSIAIGVTEFGARVDELPRDKMIVTYCT
jgi:3-mercaptopyruvate sulfurtransferase SseA